MNSRDGERKAEVLRRLAEAFREFVSFLVPSGSVQILRPLLGLRLRFLVLTIALGLASCAEQLGQEDSGGC